MDLAKAFDKILTEMIRLAVRKFAVGEWLVLAVMSIYTGAKQL